MERHQHQHTIWQFNIHVHFYLDSQVIQLHLVRHFAMRDKIIRVYKHYTVRYVSKVAFTQSTIQPTQDSKTQSSPFQLCRIILSCPST